MGSIKHFVKNTGIFLLGNLLSKLISFAMLPLYTSLISPADFGYVDVAIVTLTLAVDVIFFDLWVVLLRRMYDAPETIHRTLNAGYILFSISCVIYAVMAFAVWALWNPPYAALILLLGVILALSSLWKYLARGFGRNYDFAISGILGAIINATLNYVLLVVHSWDYSAIFIAQIVSVACEMLYLELRVGFIRYCRPVTSFRDQLPIIRQLFLLALPVGLNALVYWFVNSFNRTLVSSYVSFDEAGFLGVATRFGTALMLVIMAMTFAWQDLAFSKGKGDSAFFSRAASVYLSALLIGAALLLPAVSFVFPFMVGEAFWQGYALVPLAVGVSVASGYSNFLVNIFYAQDRNLHTLYALSIAAVFNLALVYPLIIQWSGAGSMLSTILAYCAGITYMLHRLSALSNIRPQWRLPILSAGLLAVSVGVFLTNIVWVTAVWSLLLVLLLAVVGWKNAAQSSSKAA